MDTIFDFPSLITFPFLINPSAFLSICFHSNLSYSKGAAIALNVFDTLIHLAKAVLSGSLRRQDRIDLRISLGRDLSVLVLID